MPNGQAQYISTRPGDIVTYACHQGYTLFGAAQRTCQANGKWDGVAPDCGELMLKNVKFLYTR